MIPNIQDVLIDQGQEPYSTVSLTSGGKHFSLLHIQIKSFTDYSGLEAAKNKPQKPYFPPQEASVYIKPPINQLWLSNKRAEKFSKSITKQEINFPKKSDTDDLIFNPYISWHGGHSPKNGGLASKGVLSFKGFNTSNFAKQIRNEYQFSEVDSISKDQIEGRAYCIATIACNTSTLSFREREIDVNLPRINIDKMGIATGSHVESPAEITIDRSAIKTQNFAIAVFIHHGSVMNEMYIKEELFPRLITKPIGIEPMGIKGPISCSLLLYEIPDSELLLVNEKPLIMMLNSSDQDAQLALMLHKFDRYEELLDS